MSENILKGLNPMQKEAVEVLSGPVLILAGAGSGKTKCLTHRIANLIASGVKGHEILAVTFTNKAANEMKERIDKMLGSLGGAYAMPATGTFHSICMRILRAEIEKLEMGFNNNFVIFDTADSHSLIKLCMKEKNIDPKEIKFRAILSHISSAKSLLLNIDQYLSEIHSGENPFTEALRTLAPLYQRKLREHNACDFDDLLTYTVQVFEKCPDVLDKYRKRWKHISVDEYQDTNFTQYRLIRLLADEHQNLCVIGDDHQSIYSFRGADFTNILNFEKDFPGARTVKLEQNYRSSGNILLNANTLIAKNRTGREKNLWTENDSGEPVSVCEVFNEKEEGQTIADKIKEKMREDDSLKFCDFAILYRMNAQSRSIEEAFMRSRLPYQIVGGTRFFDRKEIKDLIAYLRLIFNSRDDVAFMRIINVPTRKIGAATIQVLKNYADNYTMSLFEILDAVDDISELPDSKKTVLKNFQTIVNDLREIAVKEPISILLDRLIKRIEFVKFLEDGTSEGESRVQNVKELFSVAGKYDIADDSLAAFLEGVALIADIDNMNNSDDAVTFMTVHSSKGLEFPNVFLPGWEDGIFPGSSSRNSADALEEERRLGYVAITRAEKKCTILHARQRLIFGRTEFS
ncbi:MAG: UvrD-helicase domain-containing protein, partial [Candidatus Peregrinibacteria bacterium]|nr:UvrD-helicase domain-containing protein [Candidatus Peregrinibacteria bacterium]